MARVAESSPVETLEAKDLKHLLHPVTYYHSYQANGAKVAATASNVYVWDTGGRQYLDGIAGLWCTAIGYGEKELARVAKEQIEKLSFSPLFFGRSNEPSILLAEKLKSMMPFDAGRVFFGLSGSDANDTQMKLMWYYHNAIGKPDRRKIIARKGAYHGLTIGSGSLTGLPAFHKAFNLPLPDVFHTESPHYYRGAREGESEAQFVERIVSSLEDLIIREGPETIAAFIAEPITGAGGVVVPPEGYYPQVHRTIFLLRLRLRDEGERAHRRRLDASPSLAGWREGDGSKPPNGAFALGGHRCPAARRGRLRGHVRRVRRWAR